MKGLILAAGLGTRFRPHTNILPKPALPFLNIPLLYYSIYVAECMGASEVFFNTHHLPEKIEDLVSNIPNSSFKTGLSYEEKILGTAGCIGKLREHLNEDFFCLNADTVIVPKSISTFKDFAESHRSSDAIMTLMVIKHPEAGKKYGAIWVDQDNKVVGFGKERPHSDATPLHYIGARMHSPEIFDFVPEGASELYIDVLPQAMKQGHKVNTFLTDSTFFDGGDLGEFLSNSKSALEMLPQNEYLQSVQARFRNGMDTQEEEVLFSQNTMVHSSVKKLGLCVFGDDVNIAENCTIENSVIAEGVKVSSNQTIKDSLVLQDC